MNRNWALIPAALMNEGAARRQVAAVACSIAARFQGRAGRQGKDEGTKAHGASE